MNWGRPPVDLGLCPATDCNGRLVYPKEWQALGDEHWCLIRRCPDCNRDYHGHHTLGDVQRYDDALNRGTSQVVSDLEILERSNQTEWTVRFVAALNHDALLPCDF